MNGEMLQICSIAAAAKKAIREKEPVAYQNARYENKIAFQFLAESDQPIVSAYKANSVSEWYEHCLKKGIWEVFLLAPVSVKHRNTLGFSNTTQSFLICFYSDNKTSCFSPKWEFDSLQKKWDVLYTEQELKNIPEKMPCFEDHTTEFLLVLDQIAELAEIIDCRNFAQIFQRASSILKGESLDFSSDHQIISLPLPKKNLRIFTAASTADVFGAMGSWNDCPPYLSQEKGLEKEYDRLSEELLRQIRWAVLYAVNMW